MRQSRNWPRRQPGTCKMESCGILPVNKPQGPTSHDIVARARRLYGTRRIGHTGTLDPLAEGLLLLCLGPATKVVRFLTTRDKTYRAVIRLGRRTTSGDAAGDEIDTADPRGITREQVEDVLDNYRGVIQQRVPDHSAVKVRGRRLYAYARKGAEVPQVIREVEVYDLTLNSFTNPDLTVTVRCAGGTYIRALARDIGDDLGCGGYLASLTRTKIGDFDNADAEKLEELEKLTTRDELDRRLRPFEGFLPFPVVVVDEQRQADIGNGRRFVPAAAEFSDRFSRGDMLLLCNQKRRGVALVTAERDSDGLTTYGGEDWFRYERVLT